MLEWLMISQLDASQKEEFFDNFGADLDPKVGAWRNRVKGLA